MEESKEEKNSDIGLKLSHDGLFRDNLEGEVGKKRETRRLARICSSGHK